MEDGGRGIFLRDSYISNRIFWNSGKNNWKELVIILLWNGFRPFQSFSMWIVIPNTIGNKLYSVFFVFMLLLRGSIFKYIIYVKTWFRFIKSFRIFNWKLWKILRRCQLYCLNLKSELNKKRFFCFCYTVRTCSKHELLFYSYLYSLHL